MEKLDDEQSFALQAALQFVPDRKYTGKAPDILHRPHVDDSDLDPQTVSSTTG